VPAPHDHRERCVHSWIRGRVDDTDGGVELVPGAHHGALEREDLPRSPATIPITLEALTYGRHAAPEIWARPSGTVPQRSVEAPAAADGAAVLPPWRDRWAVVQDAALRLRDRAIGRASAAS